MTGIPRAHCDHCLFQLALVDFGPDGVTCPKCGRTSQLVVVLLRDWREASR